MEKVVTLEKKRIGFRASAGTVATYRSMFQRDLLIDMSSFEEDIKVNGKLSIESLGIAEKAVWIMAKEYDDSIPELEEWYKNFSPFFIHNACIVCLNMWLQNIARMNTSKKK